jgi:hypothetical protein
MIERTFSFQVRVEEANVFGASNFEDRLFKQLPTDSSFKKVEYSSFDSSNALSNKIIHINVIYHKDPFKKHINYSTFFAV